MAEFATVADLDYFGQLDKDVEEDKQGVSLGYFTTAEKEKAIDHANAKVLYMMKDWETFFTATIDVYVRVLLVEAESYYALGILFEMKSKRYLNNAVEDSFAVGDLNVSPAVSSKKEMALNCQILSKDYMNKGNKIMQSIMPPGSDAIRTTFYFDTCKGLTTVDEESNTGGTLGSVD